MAIITRTSDSEPLAALPWDEVPAWLADEGLDAADVTVTPTAAEVLAARRAAIHTGAGDTHRLLGSATDGVLYLMLEIGRMCRALQAASVAGPVRSAAEPLATALAPLVDGVDDGSVTLPHEIKSGGRDAQLAEIWTRATAVAGAISGVEDVAGDDPDTTDPDPAPDPIG